MIFNVEEDIKELNTNNELIFLHLKYVEINNMFNSNDCMLIDRNGLYLDGLLDIINIENINLTHNNCYIFYFENNSYAHKLELKSVIYNTTTNEILNSNWKNYLTIS